MRSTARVLGLAAVLGVLLLLPACGRLQRTSASLQRGSDLRKLGAAYLAYHEAKGRGPADQKVWLAWARDNSPEAVPLIERAGPGGDFVILYGVKIPDDCPEGSAKTVLGYDTQSGSTGRDVLLASGG